MPITHDPVNTTVTWDDIPVGAVFRRTFATPEEGWYVGIKIAQGGHNFSRTSC